LNIPDDQVYNFTFVDMLLIPFVCWSSNLRKSREEVFECCSQVAFSDHEEKFSEEQLGIVAKRGFPVGGQNNRLAG
jgi:hypothetical protein